MRSARRLSELRIALAVVAAIGCGTPSPRGPQLVERLEQTCLARGWKRTTIQLGGSEREVWWRGPAGAWSRGAIVAFHGGGGAGSNFCANIGLGAPMVEFADAAIARGFAVFAPDSTSALLDGEGRRCGKRWDSLAHPGRDNLDLGLVEYVIDHLIPDQRPTGSAEGVFATGVSNGGFMTMLVASQFAAKLRAFAPVSAGDPYGTYLDCREELSSLRANAPGIFADSTTRQSIAEPGACLAKTHEGEVEWPAVTVPIPFKLAFDENDGAVDVSCKREAIARLAQAGFHDAGAIVLPPEGERGLFHHFWLGPYNRPILDFFETQSSAAPGR